MIRVAILGAGIGREHLAAYRVLSDKFSVTHIVDLDPARVEEIRQPDDRFTTETSAEAVFGSEDVDLIDICLPPHLHVPTACSALAAGRHVICEKPLATSMHDVDQIRAAAKRSGKSVFPVFQYRWGPAFDQLQYLMGQGLTGPAHLAAIETHWNRGEDYYAVPWRGTWAGEQGGAVLGHAIHNHDLLTHLLGPVACVSAMTTTRINNIETEDCAAISFAMESGALATSSITLGAGFDRTRFQIIFEHLTATSGTTPYAPGSDRWTFVARDLSAQAEIDQAVADAPAKAAGFTGFLSEVSKSLAGQPNNAVTLDDGARSIELVTAIYHAARSGERVSLPLSLNHPLYHGWQP